jgi:hypothetical protein
LEVSNIVSRRAWIRIEDGEVVVVDRNGFPQHRISYQVEYPTWPVDHDIWVRAAMKDMEGRPTGITDPYIFAMERVRHCLVSWEMPSWLAPPLQRTSGKLTEESMRVFYGLPSPLRRYLEAEVSRAVDPA